MDKNPLVLETEDEIDVRGNHRGGPARNGPVPRKQPRWLERDWHRGTVCGLVLIGPDHRETEREAEALRRLGYVALTAATVGGMKAALKYSRFGVVVMHEESFSGTGPQVVRRLLEDQPRVRVIVAATLERTWEEAFKAGGVFRYVNATVGSRAVQESLVSAFRANPAASEKDSRPCVPRA